MGIEKGRPSEQSPKMKGIFYEAMQEKKLSESPKPLILLGFSKSSVSPFAPRRRSKVCSAQNPAAQNELPDFSSALPCSSFNAKNRMNNQINGISPSNKLLVIYMEAGRGVAFRKSNIQ